MRISFLLHDAFGVGGTIRTVLNLADALSERHSVEIVSVYKNRARPRFQIPKHVRLVSLVDIRERSATGNRLRASARSELVPPAEQYFDQYNGLTDDRISAYMARCRSDVVIGTRPSLNLCIAQVGSPSMLKVAQEHMTYEMLPAELRSKLREHYPGIDASVTVTEADASAFRSALCDTGSRFLCIPNSVPRPAISASDGSHKIAMAAGRLVDWKRFDLLVRAFRKVVDKRDDWSLRIYGEGSQLQGLRNLVSETGLSNHVIFMGRVSPLEPEWAKASIGVSSSDVEPFGMTLVEAMRCGVPMVATDCRHGPPEIVRHGEDGLLSPVGDCDALADAMLRLIDDDGLRKRMGAAALQNAERYDPTSVAKRYESLLRGSTKAGARPRNATVVESAARKLSDLSESVSTLELRPRAIAKSLLGRHDQPVADCHVSASGEVNLRLGAVRRAERPMLICRAVDTQGKRELRIPFRYGTGDRTSRPRALTASIPAGTLEEGRWSLHLERLPGHVQRLRAGVQDLRALLKGTSAPAGKIAVLKPYASPNGLLLLRSWIRETHFEVLAVWFEAEQLIVEGRSRGSIAAPENPTLALARSADEGESLAVRGEALGDARYRFALPIREIADRRLLRSESWYSYFTDRNGVQALAGRILTDFANVRSGYSFPAMRLCEDVPSELYEESPPTSVRVYARYESNGDLAVRVSEEQEDGYLDA